MRGISIFSKVTPHPGYTFATNHIIRINQFVDSRDGGDVSTDHDLPIGVMRRTRPAHLAELPKTQMIPEMPTMS